MLGWNRINKVVCGIFLAAFIAYGVLIIYLYHYYSVKATEAKQSLLSQYHEKVLTLTENKIKLLYADLSANSDDKTTISVQNHNLVLCANARCAHYNLFKLESSIKQILPDFINCRIELDENLIYSNAQTTSYQVEAARNLVKHLKINVGISISDTYWGEQERLIWQPFWIVLGCAICNILILLLLYGGFHYFLTKKYEQRYLDKYQSELSEAKVGYEKELKDKDTYFMQKVWDSNFNKQKDLELNYLFTQAANKIAFDNGLYEEFENIDGYKTNDAFRGGMPCSIILYQGGNREPVNISKLAEAFTGRFSNEAENISCTVTNSIKTHHFSSEAALYQIIYSCISYLFYILRQQLPKSQYSIRLYIDKNDDEKLVLKFIFDGAAFNLEEDLLKMSHPFFKSHSNPFILDLNQVFSVLRSQGFSCSISSDGKLNTIEIVEGDMDDRHYTGDAPNNIILLSSARRRKK